MCLLVMLVFIIWVIYELYPLFKQQMWRELWINICLSAISLTFTLLLCFNVEIPKITPAISEFIASVFGEL